MREYDDYVHPEEREKILATLDKWAYKCLDGYAETDVLTFWCDDDHAYPDPNYDGHPMSTFDVKTHEQFLTALDRLISIEDARHCECRECAA
jgi:hypothetical protein